MTHALLAGGNSGNKRRTWTNGCTPIPDGKLPVCGSWLWFPLPFNLAHATFFDLNQWFCVASKQNTVCANSTVNNKAIYRKGSVVSFSNTYKLWEDQIDTLIISWQRLNVMPSCLIPPVLYLTRFPQLCHYKQHAGRTERSIANYYTLSYRSISSSSGKRCLRIGQLCCVVKNCITLQFLHPDLANICGLDKTKSMRAHVLAILSLCIPRVHFIHTLQFYL